jgi:hypothetical protein
MSIFIKTDTPPGDSSHFVATPEQGLTCKNPVPENTDKNRYYNPESASHKPLAVTRASALQMEPNRSSDFGIDRAYFSRSDIEDLINGNKEIGIRFYLADADGRKGDASIIAVGVNASRGDQRSIGGKYKMSSSGDPVNPSVQSLALNDAKRYVQNADNIYQSNFSAFFSQDEINRLLDVAAGQKADGIEVFPAHICINQSNPQQEFSMAAGPVIAGRTLPSTLSTHSISAMPCPPDCSPQQRYIPQ